MYAIVRPFLMIALLRAGPQDLPASVPLLLLALMVYVLLGTGIAIPYYDVPLAILQAVGDAVLLSGFCWLILRLRVRAARLAQSLTALAGTGVIIGACLFVPTLVLAHAGEAGPLAGFASLLYLGLVCWLLLVWGHIFRRALDLDWLGWGVLAALAYLILSAVLLDTLVGGGSTT